MAEQTAGVIEDPPTTPEPPIADGQGLPLGVRGRAGAGALMWQWQNKGEAKAADRASQLRKKGVLQAAIGLAVAAVFFAVDFKIMAIVVSSIAFITLLTAIVSPLGAYAAIEGALAKFAMWVGAVVGWLVLMPVFVGFFVPFGLIFRRGQKDPMKRVFVPDAESYWREREADSDIEGRRRSQF